MNIEAQNLDSLRKLVRELQEENKKLKIQLKKANIAFPEKSVFEERMEDSSEYDPDQGGRIINRYITEDMANRYFAMFWGRTDVYAKRGRSGGYFPQCENRWNDKLCPKQQGEKIRCEDCENTQWSKLTVKKIMNHLVGYKEDASDVIGVYPVLADGTCRFIVFDFDNHEMGAEATDFANVDEEWHKEVDALRMICEKNGITPLVERSRSGKGAHVWIFFKRPISAVLARNFGFLLLDRGQASINMKSFQYYDRMYPCQDTTSSLGNLIALPLQGQALKKGNSAFVDKNWNAYPEQWDILLNHTEKLSIEELKSHMEKWREGISETTGITSVSIADRPKPWKKKQTFDKSDVVGKLHIILGNGVYIDTLNLMPRIQNQIRSMVAFDNPIFYKNKRLGYSNYNNFSAVYMGRDIDGYICIPRGLREVLIGNCEETGIEYDIADHREKGRPIRVKFNGELRTGQDLAADRMLRYDYGILSATTAFGKTVVCSYLISQRKVNTLILLQNKDLLEQWVEELNEFLDINEEPPVYKTKTGREKRRNSVIGVLTGNKNTLTGIIDVAMVGSMYSKGNFNEFINSYGMVIMDECHHCGSNTSIEVMRKVNARYVYGVSATPKRGDNLEEIIYMLLGPIRHSYTAKERAREQGIDYFVYPRFTRVIDTNEAKTDINGAYSLISDNSVRNEMIIADTKASVAAGRTPVILTRLKEQAKYFYDSLSDSADYVFILYGDNSDKENSEVRRKLREVSNDKSLVLIATGQKIGEGFDFPRLDTLMLAAPVSFDGRLEQYVGRLHRDYEGKKNVIVYDYIDSHIRAFKNMYLKRLRTYRRLGYSLISDMTVEKQNANTIYDSGNYTDVFEQDLVEAEKRIIISSPLIEQDKVDRFLYITKPRQEAGCKVTVITSDPETSCFSGAEYYYSMIRQMQAVGVHVITKDRIDERFALIDDELVWHGGMNLLGKEDAWDNLMRIKSAQVAEELLELSLGNKN
ncbi:TOTE conflict system archaeo-eukaryotic primase domain-containing protein [Clostridium transplantifaecale]|uniref:TOTE conflict system archaeo-eukaryotic primase domain-containing protein n=1 Tax=Clostridium transplantifaecale TaxID=2479838 RepID=UPI000F63B38E|nr:DEAD/DEAH box helicase family protein [Clostridium transplantifaecale]